MKRPILRLPSASTPDPDPNLMDTPFALNTVNWSDEGSIIELARKLGPGNAVVKYRSRRNYNIVRLSRAHEIVDHKSVLLIYVVPSMRERE